MTHLADTDAGEEGQSSANVILTNRVRGNVIFLITAAERYKVISFTKPASSSFKQ